MSTEIAVSTLKSDSSLKAYYRFSTGALKTDSGNGAGHTLTDISAPTEGTGVFGKCAVFAGDDAYSTADHADFKPTGNFSISLWVKASSTAANQYLFQSLSINTAYAGIAVYLRTTTTKAIYAYSGKNSGTTKSTDWEGITGSTQVGDGNWHLVVFTWDGSSLCLYVDGVSDATPVTWANAPSYAVTNYVRVGDLCHNGDEEQFLTGSLDDVALWNGIALSQSYITELWRRRMGGLITAGIIP